MSNKLTVADCNKNSLISSYIMKNPFNQKILFLKVKAQDPEAYGKFYDLYVKRIYRFIYFKVNSVAETQDLTSETFLRVWQSIREGKEIRNLNAFIYIIARNLVIDFYRRKNTDAVSLDDENAPEIPDSGKDILQEQMIDSDLQATIKGLDKLKDEYKEAIVLKYFDELSISEIAEVLNKSKGAVRVLLHRALNTLKENIND